MTEPPSATGPALQRVALPTPAPDAPHGYQAWWEKPGAYKRKSPSSGGRKPRNPLSIIIPTYRSRGKRKANSPLLPESKRRTPFGVNARDGDLVMENADDTQVENSADIVAHDVRDHASNSEPAFHSSSDSSSDGDGDVVFVGTKAGSLFMQTIIRSLRHRRQVIQRNIAYNDEKMARGLLEGVLRRMFRFEDTFKFPLDVAKVPQPYLESRNKFLFRQRQILRRKTWRLGPPSRRTHKPGPLRQVMSTSELEDPVGWEEEERILDLQELLETVRDDIGYLYLVGEKSSEEPEPFFETFFDSAKDNADLIWRWGSFRWDIKWVDIPKAPRRSGARIPISTERDGCFL